MSEIKEFKVDSYTFFPKTLFQLKEFLKENKQAKIIATSYNASKASHLAETLKRLGYIEFDNVKTDTVIDDGNRHVRLIITVHVSSNFDKLYKEHEEERKKKEDERKKKEEEKKKDK